MVKLYNLLKRGRGSRKKKLVIFEIHGDGIKKVT
jgi:hypothetical protein